MIREHLPSTLDYLLGQRDCKNRKRPAYIVAGNCDTFMAALRGMPQKTNQYITLCFRDAKTLNELGGKKFLDDFQHEVLTLMLPGLDHTQFHYMFIVHDNNKHDFELNFVLLQSVANKRFYGYYDRVDRKCFEAFDRYIHAKYPQLTDPLKPELKRELATENKPWEAKQQGLFLEIKDKVEGHQPPITNKEQFLAFMRDEGYKVTRIRKSSVTITQNGTSIKLVGALCSDPQTQSENLAEKYETLLNKRHDNLINKYPILKTYERERNNPENIRTADISNVGSNQSNVNQHAERPEFGGIKNNPVRIGGQHRFASAATIAINRVRLGANSGDRGVACDLSKSAVEAAGRCRQTANAIVKSLNECMDIICGPKSVMDRVYEAFMRIFLPPKAQPAKDSFVLIKYLLRLQSDLSSSQKIARVNKAIVIAQKNKITATDLDKCQNLDEACDKIESISKARTSQGIDR